MTTDSEAAQALTQLAQLGREAAVTLREWKPLPGFSSYEASHRGQVRSLDRTLANGRAAKGVVLKWRNNNKGYLLVDLIDDEGVRWTKTVHSLVLLAHVGKRPPGQQSRHLDDNPENNRWPENLIYGTPAENVADRMANSPAVVRPPKVCVRCDGEFEGNGRRCHPCVVTIGKQGAALLSTGMPLDKAAVQLDYPSAVGLHTLAVKYAGYGQRRSRSATKMAVTLREWVQDHFADNYAE